MKRLHSVTSNAFNSSGINTRAENGRKKRKRELNIDKSDFHLQMASS